MDHRGALPLETAPAPELLTELVHTMSQLIARHIALAKTEALQQLRRELRMAGSIAAASALAYGAVLLLLGALVSALALVLPIWAAFLVSAALALSLAGLIALAGYRARIRTPLRRTRELLQEDVRWLKPKTV
jgi:hypothetical protein